MASVSNAGSSVGVKEEHAQGDAPRWPDKARQVDQLYNKCAQRPKGTIFYQRDLSNMQVAETMGRLTEILQEMVDRHLMKLMTFDGRPCWRLRSRAEAEKLRKLTPEERLLYHHIDQSQVNGIWSKALRARTNLSQQMLTKCLKSMESKELIQSVMSVKHPNRKMYLLKHLRPSVEIAGGPWQTEGDFDMALIRTVTGLVEAVVRQETCISLPANWNNYRSLERASAIAQKKALSHADVRDIEDVPVRTFRPPVSASVPRIVLRDRPNYPTAALIRQRIMETGIIKGKKFSVTDLEQILEMMVLEGRLEKTSGTNYRLAMGYLKKTEATNGFVDAPCGNCPVFDLCGEDGEISARTCVYFGEWLETESETYTH